jgi:peptidoglycan/xylan/chitin deacetylase (PgdA/CDA1 family)
MPRMRPADLIKRTLRLVGKAVPPDPGGRFVVLCYHSIHPSLPFRSATPELFDEHLHWLRQHCEIVPFSGLSAARANASSRPVVSVTFDDGYVDNHEYALPTLVRHGITATFFLTAGFLENDAAVLARFRALRGVSDEMIRPLSWSQLDEMRASGMDVGAHTYAHPNLARLEDRDLEDELKRSRRVLEDHTGTAVTMMAYPFGRPKVHVDERVVVAVRRSGYTLAATTATRGLRAGDDPLTIPRFFATNDSVAVLREKVLGEWDLIGVVRERAPKAIVRFVSPRDFSF